MVLKLHDKQGIRKDGITMLVDNQTLNRVTALVDNNSTKYKMIVFDGETLYTLYSQRGEVRLFSSLDSFKRFCDELKIEWFIVSNIKPGL